MWNDVWQMGIPVADKAVRTVLVYAGILALLRLAGKRELAQLNSFDLVVLLLLSNVVQNAIIGPDNSVTGGLLGATILVAVNVVLVRTAYVSPLVGRILQGAPATLFRFGQFNERRLLREAITKEELIAGLRRQGLELKDVEQIDLQPEGTFNAKPKPKPDLEDVMRKLEAIERRLG